jgi:hypothetical protein
MRMLEVQSCRIALEDDRQDASYPVHEWTWLRGPISPTGSSAKSARAVVEVRRGGGGILPSALLGGEISAISDGSYVLRVAQSTDMTLGAPRTCVSRFWGSLAPGLPEEFALPALEGAGRVPKEPGVGVMVSIDRGAYDEVNSSPLAFRVAGKILAIALLANLRSVDIAESDLAGVDLSGVSGL